MIVKKKSKYEVTTTTKCLVDTAIYEAGGIAYNTFMTQDVTRSNDYYIPFHTICAVAVKTSLDEVEVEDKTCVTDEPTPSDKPKIIGANNVEINQGIGIDLYEGVYAVDAQGNEIPFTVEPSELDKCDIGVHYVYYTATDSHGNTVTVVRQVGICKINDPTIDGATDIVVAPNEEFDPLDGVTAVDGNGNPVEVEVKE